MVDYGVVKRVHYISITDSYSPLVNRRAFYDASFALPPSMCECYIENSPVKTAAEFRTMLRSGMMGWCTIMCDTNRWTVDQHLTAQRQFALYKSVLRPLIGRGNLYHVAARPDGKHWDGIEYASTDEKSAVLFAFRGNDNKASNLFRLYGLNANSKYTVKCEDGGSPQTILSGRELMEKGISVTVPEADGSEIVTIKRV
jgi:hypothetical protein